MEITFDNVIIFTVNETDQVINKGTVIVQDRSISFVGPSDQVAKNQKKGRLIDGKGRMALLPGLIDAHSHSSLLRGFTENKQLLDWLPEYQLEHQVLTEDDVYAATLLCYLEAVSGGTTCVMDMYRFLHRASDAAREIGIRVNLVPYVATAEGKDFFETIESNERLVASHHMAENGKVRVWLGMEHLFYCTPETYSWAAHFSREHGIGIHTHSSEQKEEVEAVIKRFGKRPIKLFSERGILGPKTVIAHCVWLDDEEIQLLAETGTSVVHCPVSNAKLACGIAPIGKLHKKGVIVGIGTDGPISNNSLDMFEEMKFASLLQKTAQFDASALSASEVLRMATIDGAKALGLDREIGSIEIGKKADLVLVDFYKPHLMPIVAEEQEANVLWNLIYAARASDVHSVCVDGELLVDAGRHTKVSPEQVLEYISKQTRSLLERRSRVKGHAVPVQN